MKYFSMFSGIGGFELGIERAYEQCNANIVEKKESSTKTTNQNAENVLRNTKDNGEVLIEKKVEQQLASTINKEGKKSLEPMEENVLVVGKQPQNFSHSIIKTTMGRQNEEVLEEQDTHTNLLLSEDTQTPTNYSATTAILPKGGMENAPICVGFSEIDKYAIQIYKKHFPNHTNFGDCTTINPSELPDFDLIVGGFPCQSFSIAGKRGGFEDTRGTLFFHIARIAKVKRPKYLLLENVKGLLSHDKGNTFATIISTLDELGYDCQWSVLNSKNFGVPQNRERVFIVGHLRGEPRPKVFPFGKSNEISHAGGEREVETANTISANYWKGVGANRPFIQQLNQPRHSNNRIYGTGGVSPTLNTAQGGNRQPKIVAPNGKEVDLSNIPDKPFQLLEVRTEKGKQTRREIRQQEGRDSTKRGKDDKKYIPKTDNLANCLTTGKENIEKWLIESTARIRRLTPTECERLQGFPDGWTEGVSDSQRYKCLGNAVTVNVIKAITEKLLTP